MALMQCVAQDLYVTLQTSYLAPQLRRGIWCFVDNRRDPGDPIKGSANRNQLPQDGIVSVLPGVSVHDIDLVHRSPTPIGLHLVVFEVPNSRNVSPHRVIHNEVVKYMRVVPIDYDDFISRRPSLRFKARYDLSALCDP